ITMCTRGVSRSMIFPLPSSPHCRPTTATTAIMSSPFILADACQLSVCTSLPRCFCSLLDLRNRRIHIVHDVGKCETLCGTRDDIMQDRLIIRQRGEAHQ